MENRVNQINITVRRVKLDSDGRITKAGDITEQISFLTNEVGLDTIINKHVLGTMSTWQHYPIEEENGNANN